MTEEEKKSIDLAFEMFDKMTKTSAELALIITGFTTGYAIGKKRGIQEQSKREKQ